MSHSVNKHIIVPKTKPSKTYVGKAVQIAEEENQNYGKDDKDFEDIDHASSVPVLLIVIVITSYVLTSSFLNVYKFAHHSMLTYSGNAFNESKFSPISVGYTNFLAILSTSNEAPIIESLKGEGLVMDLIKEDLFDIWALGCLVVSMMATLSQITGKLFNLRSHFVYLLSTCGAIYLTYTANENSFDLSTFFPLLSYLIISMQVTRLCDVLCNLLLHSAVGKKVLQCFLVPLSTNIVLHVLNTNQSFREIAPVIAVYLIICMALRMPFLWGKQIDKTYWGFQ